MKSNEKATVIDAKVISFSAVAAIIGAGLALGMGVSAYGGEGLGFRRGLDSEDRDALRSAISNGDYSAWSELATQQCEGMITEDHFNEMVERHAEQTERHDAIEQALEANDFEAWSNLIAENDDWGRGRLSEVITEDNFSTFVALHEAIEAGDVEKAQELREELGLEAPLRDGTGFKGRGMRGGMRASVNN